jgi:selenocysteine lyase/cysteine desulfurase
MSYGHAASLQRTQPPLSRLEYLNRQLGERVKLNPSLRSLHSEFETIARDLREAGAGNIPAELGPEPYRELTRTERIEARHWLQELSEHARSVRNAMHPAEGVQRVTVTSWEGQWQDLRKHLDAYTARVRAGKDAPGGLYDRNETPEVTL